MEECVQYCSHFITVLFSYIRSDVFEKIPTEKEQFKESLYTGIGDREIQTILTDFDYQQPFAAIILQLLQALQNRLATVNVVPLNFLQI